MKKMILMLVSLVLLLVVLYLTISNLNGTSFSIEKAEKIADEYLHKEYPNDTFSISEGTYEKNYGNYSFHVIGSSGTVNNLVLQEGLKTIEDTNVTSEFNQKVTQFIQDNSDFPIKTVEVNGTVMFSTDQFIKNNKIWITFTGNQLSNEKVANFGHRIINWSKKEGISLNRVIIDYTNLTSNESYRLSIDERELNNPEFLTMIKKIN